MAEPRRGSIAARRESIVQSYRHGSISSARKSIGGALEAAYVVPQKHGPAFDNDSSLEEFYKPIPSYEGYHRYDPEYVWTADEEKKVVRKVSLVYTCKFRPSILTVLQIDWRICTWACLMFFAL